MFTNCSEKLRVILYFLRVSKGICLRENEKVKKRKIKNFSSVNLVFQVDTAVVSEKHRRLYRRSVTVYVQNTTKRKYSEKSSYQHSKGKTHLNNRSCTSSSTRVRTCTCVNRVVMATKKITLSMSCCSIAFWADRIQHHILIGLARCYVKKWCLI